MSDQSKIHILYVNNEPYLIGSLRSLSMRTKDEVRPENFETFSIEEKLDSYIKTAAEKVTEIEEIRQCSTYQCEHELSIYSNIQDITRDSAYTRNELFGECMRYSKGKVNPALIQNMIQNLFTI